MDNNTLAFLILLRTGLWGKENHHTALDGLDYKAIYRQAEEQSVLGLVAAGIDQSVGLNVPKEERLLFVSSTLHIEQRNLSMNLFIQELIDKLRIADVYTLLVKGQGIAQCYEKPLWRSCGDIDLLFSRDYYFKAKELLLPLASSVEKENLNAMHMGMTIGQWTVELHGTMRSCCLSSMDKMIDIVQKAVFSGGNVRSWMNGNTIVFIPSPDNDVFLIFSHIIKHYFCGGIGMRQICDWCRLLWTYRSNINIELLEERLKNAGIMTEWRAFAVLAVNYLDMPVKAMPFYSSEKKWKSKANRILDYVLRVGNFGHSRDMSFHNNKSLIVRKTISFLRQTTDAIDHFKVFPLDSTKVWLKMFFGGIIAVGKGA